MLLPIVPWRIKSSSAVRFGQPPPDSIEQMHLSLGGAIDGKLYFDVDRGVNRQRLWDKLGGELRYA